MSAYMVIRIKIIDPVQLLQYQKVAPAIIEKFGGKLLALGDDVVSLEGPAEPRRIIIAEFEGLEHAKRFYQSAEYTEAIELRKDAAECELVAFDSLI